VFGGEESSRLVIKGYHPPKDGIVAGLFAAKTLATRRPSLTKQLNARYQRPGEVAAARVGVVLSSAQSMSSPSKVQPNPDIGSCLLKRLNRISGARVQFAGGDSCADVRPEMSLFVRKDAESESIDYLEVSLEQGC
jgi:phosphomannomutase